MILNSLICKLINVQANQKQELEFNQNLRFPKLLIEILQNWNLLREGPDGSTRQNEDQSKPHSNSYIMRSLCLTLRITRRLTETEQHLPEFLLINSEDMNEENSCYRILNYQKNKSKNGKLKIIDRKLFFLEIFLKSF